jgi:hypothetical protein
VRSCFCERAIAFAKEQKKAQEQRLFLFFYSYFCLLPEPALLLLRQSSCFCERAQATEQRLFLFQTKIRKEKNKTRHKSEKTQIRQEKIRKDTNKTRHK